jgi:spermidine/putrescine transport system substrate-binding protein
LEALASRYNQKEITLQEYTATLSEMMNDTSIETMAGVKKELEKMRTNLYGLETDEAKNDIAAGRLSASYQWSGDAVYIIDSAESESDLLLEYAIPSSASNLWFDGWVMMEGANQEASMAFINFLSRYDNAIRNMYYIGYTSCMAGEQVYEYVDYAYGEENGTAEHDLSYFFGDGHTLKVSPDQLSRQLFAQYPDEKTITRCVAMRYFNRDENARANNMWNDVTFS